MQAVSAHHQVEAARRRPLEKGAAFAATLVPLRAVARGASVRRWPGGGRPFERLLGKKADGDSVAVELRPRDA